MLPWRPQQSQQQSQAHPEASSNNLPAPNHSGEGQQQAQPMPHQQQQQQQQQQPQSPTNNVPQQQQQVPAPPVPSSSAQAPAPPAMSLSHVLHFLQTEFRKYERDRNEWEIERGEMRARIALLEGERRGNENARNDLIRRVRMLEFALKGERSKYLALAANQQSQPIKASQKADDNEASSPTSSEAAPSEAPANSAPGGTSLAAPQPTNSVQLSALPSYMNMSRPSSAQSMNQPMTTLNGIPLMNKDGKDTASNAGGGTGTTVWNPAIGRDAKGRAKSRDYLKQCLQEISYLTSASTLNPLPDRSASGVPRLRNGIIQLPAGTTASAQMQPSTSAVPSEAPSVSLPPPSLRPFQLPPAQPAQTAQEVEITSAPQQNGILPPLPVDAPPKTPSSPLSDLPIIAPETSEKFEANPFNAQGVPYGEPAPLLETSTEDPFSSESDSQSREEPKEEERGERSTAIFRPESKTAWRAKLKAAGEAASFSAESDTGEVEADLANLELGEREEKKEEGGDRSTWKARKVLRSHLDAVRSVAFARSSDVVLASGGDDATVKLWRLPSHSLTPGKNSTTEIEPQITYRGHSGPVTAVAFSSSQDRLYSASLDQTVHVWALPPRERETYAPYDPELSLATLDGHTDAIWDLAVIPLRVQDENLLATASADGTVKIWNTDRLDSPLRLSWKYNGTDSEEEEKDLPIPTSVSVCCSDMRKIVVAYDNSVVKLFDVESGKEVLKFKSDETYDGTTATQINQAVSHPTLPLLVTAHEDKYIRVFDLNTGECTHSMLAHLDAVISLDIDPAGLNVVSGGHDCSLRFWDLLSTHTCVQELATHRLMAKEGILAAKYHPTLPYVATSGADGLVKLYGH